MHNYAINNDLIIIFKILAGSLPRPTRIYLNTIYVLKFGAFPIIVLY